MSAKEELRGIAFWADALSEEEAAHALKGIAHRHFRAGEYICHCGDRLDFWTGVFDGLVKVGAVSESGRPMAFTGVGRGGWFGEGAILKNEARKYDLVALRDTRLAMMNRATFMWLFQTSIRFTQFLVHHLNERVAQFAVAIECERMHDQTVRVARNLAWLFNPVLYPHVDTHIEITQEELALLVGASRQMTNKALLQLEAAGLLVSERAGVRIVDLTGLARYEG